MVIWIIFSKTDLTVEINSKSLIKAIGKVLYIYIYSWSVARTPIKTHKGNEKWPFYVNKQLFWWSTSIILDNKNVILTDL